MATPTPASASKRPGGGVSTPSHLNQSSPAPRSVPSPNAARHHPAGKTPVNHPTTSSSHGSKTVSSTPMVQNLSQSGHSASPGVNALGTPGLGGLGIEGITPSALHNMPTPLAFAMSRSDSEMRMGAVVTKRNEDEERRTKMRKVLKSIGRPKGRVSEEGIARLARRVGMVSDIDDEKLTQEERERKVGNRSFSVAGDSVIVTVDLNDQIPQNLEVNGDVPEPDQAARVLLRDLKECGDVPLTASLNGFARNLSYLAQMDRLKKETETECFAAIGGIYRSLRRLHGKEQDVANEQVVAGKIDMDVMCKGSGRPVMHVRHSLGLCLDYWQQSRYQSESSTPDESKMDLDEPVKNGKAQGDCDIWTLLIGAEKHNAAKMPYLPLRVSDQWLPEDITLPPADSGESIKWLEPEDDQQSLSKPCFMATIEPPVVLPYGAADAILKSFGVQNVPDMQSIPSYVSLLIATSSGAQVPQSATAAGLGRLFAEQMVMSMREGASVQVQHQYTLDNAKPDFGFLLRELPFAHPKQLVELLPTLRQWAAFGTLLGQIFDIDSLSKQSEAKGQKSHHQNGHRIAIHHLDDTTLTSDGRAPLGVNMALSTTPQPTINVTFQTASHQMSIANIEIHILRNADVEVEIWDGFDFDSDEAKAKTEAKMAKALDVCWDIGVWVEWVRGEFR